MGRADARIASFSCAEVSPDGFGFAAGTGIFTGKGSEKISRGTQGKGWRCQGNSWILLVLCAPLPRAYWLMRGFNSPHVSR